MVDIKMYMSEISKFKISDLKPQKMTILWTLKHVSAISKHPVLQCIYLDLGIRLYFLFTGRSLEIASEMAMDKIYVKIIPPENGDGNMIFKKYFSLYA